jgi:hypothetical protein
MEIVAALVVFGVVATMLAQMTTLSLSFQRGVDEQRRMSAAITELLEEFAAGPLELVTAERLQARAEQIAETFGPSATVTTEVREVPAEEVGAAGLAAREMRVVMNLDGRWPARVEHFTYCHALTETQP